MTYEDDWEDYYDEDYEDEWSDPCSRCGPWCPEWAGDGLCNLVLEQLASDDEAYREHCIHNDVICPVCGEKLTQYDVMASELWTWPGDWLNPMIALGVYAAYGAPKGEVHRLGNVCHIWVGEGEFREEKLIRLLGQDS